MESTEFKLKTSFNVIDYVSMVNDIANGFFSAEGDYEPHIGNLNAMKVFYNDVIIESKFDMEHNIDDALEMDVLVEDEDFIKEFNKALEGDGLYRYDFSSAYYDAMDIVDTRKNSLGQAVDVLKKALNDVVDKINPIFENSNFEQIAQIADQVSKGEFNLNTLIDAYGGSDRIKEIAEKE